MNTKGKAINTINNNTLILGYTRNPINDIRGENRLTNNTYTAIYNNLAKEIQRGEG